MNILFFTVALFTNVYQTLRHVGGERRPWSGGPCVQSPEDHFFFNNECLYPASTLLRCTQTSNPRRSPSTSLQRMAYCDSTATNLCEPVQEHMVLDNGIGFFVVNRSSAQPSRSNTSWILPPSSTTYAVKINQRPAREDVPSQLRHLNP
jgi:hypothetical protein